MNRALAFAFVICVCGSGCASSDLSAAVDQDAQGENGLVADLGNEHCERIGFFLQGARLSRPFRIVRMLEDRWSAAPGDRYLSLQLQACRLGADAIIETREVWLAEGRVATVGYAIVFTDSQPLD